MWWLEASICRRQLACDATQSGSCLAVVWLNRSLSESQAPSRSSPGRPSNSIDVLPLPPFGQPPSAEVIVGIQARERRLPLGSRRVIARVHDAVSDEWQFLATSSQRHQRRQDSSRLRGEVRTRPGRHGGRSPRPCAAPRLPPTRGALADRPARPRRQFRLEHSIVRIALGLKRNACIETSLLIREERVTVPSQGEVRNDSADGVLIQIGPAERHVRVKLHDMHGVVPLTGSVSVRPANRIVAKVALG